MCIVEAEQPPSVARVQAERTGEAMRPLSRRFDAPDPETDPVISVEPKYAPIETQQKLEAIVGVIRRHIISSHDIIATAPRRRKSWPVVRRPTSSDGHTRNFDETKLTRAHRHFGRTKATASAGAISDKTNLIRSASGCGELNLHGKKQQVLGGRVRAGGLGGRGSRGGVGMGVMVGAETAGGVGKGGPGWVLA